MTNKEIYSKTLTFSVSRFLVDLLSLVILVAMTLGGFFLADKLQKAGLVGLVIGLILGIIVAWIIARFISYKYKAAQIAMMARAVTEGSLPADVRAEGFAIVKERFVTVAVYFAVTRAVKGVFQQLGRLITRVGTAVGGETGNTVGNVISSGVQTLVGYLCDCCLGWIFFRAGESAFKAACEGSVLFFRHGKTLLRNMGRIFGMGIASLLVIGGIFTGIFYLIFSQFPDFFASIAGEISSSGNKYADMFSNVSTAILIFAAIAGIILWSFLHSFLVRPFILVGVLRNYMEAGMNDIPSESSFAELASKSPKFAEMQRKA